VATRLDLISCLKNQVSEITNLLIMANYL
jgi:hypothetical protein